MAPREENRGESRPPEYYLLITNVALSPMGKEKCLAAIGEFAPDLSMDGWDIWDSDHVSRFLDLHNSVRQQYLPFIAPGDLIAALEEAYGVSAIADIGRSVAVQSISDFMRHQRIRLTESDLDAGEPALAAVAVDLPCKSNGRDDGEVLSVVLAFGENVMRPQGDTPRGILLVGGPGQGKSTLAKLICQAYRLSLLDGAEYLDSTQLRALDRMRTAFRRIGVGLPSNRRWPLYVELSQFGDRVLEALHDTLLHHIGSQIRVHGAPLKPNQVAQWLKAWPSIIVLDGLDEVPHKEVRERVREELDRFIADINMDGADVMLVITTRPQGYHGELDEYPLQRLELSQLSPARAVAYGRLLAEYKYEDNQDQLSKVVGRIEDASLSASIQKLMTTPLQVTIITTLLDQRTRVPDTRFALFEAYYSTIYSRELEKKTYLTGILADNQDVIDYVHEQVALFLHVQAETPGQAESLLEEKKLEQLIQDKLEDSGFDARNKKKKTEQIIRAVKNRVVLLVSLREGFVGFEVRSIQEYLAARALAKYDDPLKATELLTLLATSSHWRNTFLFAAAILAKKYSSQWIDSFLVSLSYGDRVSAFARVSGSGRNASLDLLGDGFARSVPRVRFTLLRHCLEMLGYWPDANLSLLADLTAKEVENNPSFMPEVREHIVRGLRSNGREQITSSMFVEFLKKGGGELAKAAVHWENNIGTQKNTGREAESLRSIILDGQLNSEQKDLLTNASSSLT